VRQEDLHRAYLPILEFPIFGLERFPNQFHGYLRAWIVPLYVASQEVANLFLLMCLLFPPDILSVFDSSGLALAAFLRAIVERELNF